MHIQLKLSLESRSIVQPQKAAKAVQGKGTESPSVGLILDIPTSNEHHHSELNSFVNSNGVEARHFNQYEIGEKIFELMQTIHNSKVQNKINNPKVYMTEDLLPERQYITGLERSMSVLRLLSEEIQSVNQLKKTPTCS